MKSFNKIAIIGAMDEEVTLLVDALKDRRLTEKAGLKFYEGLLEGKNVVVVKCGVAKVNAALCTQILISEFKVDSVINTGVAGAIHKDVGVNDIVISTEAIQYDVDASEFGDPVGTIPRLDNSVFEADEALINAVQRAIEKIDFKHNWFKGRILTGDRFVGNHEFKKHLNDNFSGMCCEMEGGAIAHVCYLNEIPYLIVRAISDSADGHADVTYNDFVHEAAESSARLVMAMLKEL